MKLATLLATLVALTPVLGHAEEPAGSLREEVMATERAFAKTMADRDHAAFASFLAPDAVFLSPGKAFRGREEIAEGWKKLYEGPEAPFSWDPEQVEVNLSGTLAVSTGPVMDPSGKRSGTFVSTWRREADGIWKIVLDSGCGCAAP